MKDRSLSGSGKDILRYADDIILLAKSRRAAQRILTKSTAYKAAKMCMTDVFFQSQTYGFQCLTCVFDVRSLSKSIYARVAELLRDSEHGASHRGIEQMAVPSRKDVYLEAMEEAEDEDTESMQVGSTLCNSLQSRKLPERLLVDKQHGSGQDGDDKRKTDTLRLL